MALATLLVFILDYATKAIAIKYFADRPKLIIGKFMKFELTFNKGAAFSLATSKTIFLSSFAIAVSAVILYIGRKLTANSWALAFGTLLGGIFGNLSDRIFREPGALQGAVVDWISIGSWPTFNIADSAVVLGALSILYLRWKKVPLRMVGK